MLSWHDYVIMSKRKINIFVIFHRFQFLTSFCTYHWFDKKKFSNRKKEAIHTVQSLSYSFNQAWASSNSSRRRQFVFHEATYQLQKSAWAIITEIWENFTIKTTAKGSDISTWICLSCFSPDSLTQLEQLHASEWKWLKRMKAFLRVDQLENSWMKFSLKYHCLRL